MTATIAERNRGGAVENPHWRRFRLPGADVRLARFCTAAAAPTWFARLRAEIPWQQHRLKIFGREVDSPRLSCWIGDAQAVYTYSRTRFEPQPWTPALRELRDAVSQFCGEVYNSVLCNLYRDGRDAMGWHSDSEPELGNAPVIASLSFGATRVFRLRHKRDAALRAEIALESGSLLLMAGATQRHYRHDLPRTAHEVGARINLTFRHIGAQDES
jgi:alkylated DNA repair dioxygenase AlkB